MPARNINTKLTRYSRDITVYDDGRPNTYGSWNPQIWFDRVESSTYVNNRKLRPVSPYSMSKKVWTVNSSTYTRRQGSSFPKYTLTAYERTYRPYPPQPSVPGASRQVALNKALLDHKKGGAFLPLIMAEGGKTLSMIATRLNTIRSFANWAKNGSPKRRKRSSRKIPRTEAQISELWLELRWGWLPLMSDIKDMMSMIAGNLAWSEVHARGESVQKVSGNFWQKNYTCDYKVYYSDLGHRGVDFKYVRKDGFRCKIRSVLNSQTAALAAANGFNPLSLAWELIPFSCVADYLVQIGDFLAALDATNGYTFKEGSITHFQTWEFDYQVDICHYSSGYPADLETETCSGTYREVIMSREVLTNYPVPRVTFSSPFSTIHSLNMLALLTKTFRTPR